MKRLTALKLTLPITLAAACAAPAATTPVPVPSPIPSSFCDFESTDFSAWTNRMPSTDGSAGGFVAAMELADDGVSRRFENAGVRNGRLRLNIVPWGPKEGLGKIVYRSTIETPTGVDVYCEGRLKSYLDEVMVVY